MIIEENLKTIQEIIKDFFEKMFFADIEIFLSHKDSILFIDLKVKNPQILIGKRGETLFKIRHLLKAILKKKINASEFFIEFDINDYKKKRIEYLKKLAREIAERVSLTKTEEFLPLMSSYERRIIHLELANFPDIFTESIGTGQERKITIKPKYSDEQH